MIAILSVLLVIVSILLVFFVYISNKQSKAYRLELDENRMLRETNEGLRRALDLCMDNMAKEKEFSSDALVRIDSLFVDGVNKEQEYQYQVSILSEQVSELKKQKASIVEYFASKL